MINDLLAPESLNLKIHEDKKVVMLTASHSLQRGVFVGGLKEEVVVSTEHVLSIIATGEAHRHMGATDYNEKSSRSHTIFIMVVESKMLQPTHTDHAVRVSYLVGSFSTC